MQWINSEKLSTGFILFEDHQPGVSPGTGNRVIPTERGYDWQMMPKKDETGTRLFSSSHYEE